MSAATIEFTVFTKAWKLPLPELARHVKQLGFDGVELPVRSGFQVEPQTVQRGLAEAVRILSDQGLRIASIAGPVDERTIAACGESQIPVIRICPMMAADELYLDFVRRMRKDLDAAVPALDRHGVTVGFQNHAGRWVCNAMGLRHLLEGYDRRHVAAVLDFAHYGLNGEPPEMALDIVWDRLCMVNLKNAIWRRTSGAQAEYAQWEWYFTRARDGFTVWPDVVRELKRHAYRGVVCLTAEYTDEHEVDRFAKEDIEFAKALFGGLIGGRVSSPAVDSSARLDVAPHERARSPCYRSLTHYRNF